jgi:drug/metabolite transporter (DMT)-like permease
MNAQQTAIGAMILSAACWGFATVMTKGALRQIPPYTLLVIQLMASISFLWLGVVITRNRVQLDQKTLLAGATGLLEPGLAYGVGMPGLGLASAANASVIVATEPALIVLLAWWLLRERPSIRLLCAVLVAVCGVTLVSLSGSIGLEHDHILGNFLVLFGTFFAALYVIASSRLVASNTPIVLAALQQTFGLVAALVLLIGAVVLGFEKMPSSISLNVILLAVASGIVQYALAFWFYLFGMKTLATGTAAMFLALIPLFGVSGAILFLGETMTFIQALGSVLVLGAVLMIALGHKETSPENLASRGT